MPFGRTTPKHKGQMIYFRSVESDSTVPGNDGPDAFENRIAKRAPAYYGPFATESKKQRCTAFATTSLNSAEFCVANRAQTQQSGYPVLGMLFVCHDARKHRKRFRSRNPDSVKQVANECAGPRASRCKLRVFPSRRPRRQSLESADYPRQFQSPGRQEAIFFVDFRFRGSDVRASSRQPASSRSHEGRNEIRRLVLARMSFGQQLLALLSSVVGVLRHGPERNRDVRPRFDGCGL